MPTTTWLLIADGSRARIFESDEKKKKLRELHNLVNPEAHLHRQNPKSYSPGRGFSSSGAGRHAYTSSHEPAAIDELRFAKDVIEALSREADRCERLVVAAPPEFLGLLRKQYPRSLTDKISVELDKDYTLLKEHELHKKLAKHLTE